MKPTYLFLILTLFAQFSHAQSEAYPNLWKKVASFEKQGLPKSALKLVEQIEEKAVKDKNSAQRIKALIYKSKYAMTLEEEAQLNIVNKFKNQIDQSEAPVKNVLQNLLADLYWQYFQQNRYRFYQRTNTIEKASEDFRTWDLQSIFDEIHKQFQASLQNENLLKSTKIEAFDDILAQVKNSESYRPTLYDLLAHNALDFYKTDENSISKPADAFQLTDPDYLSALDTFKSIDIKSSDTTSLQLNALKIYQSLIHFHADQQNIDALIDVDIQRLRFVHQNTNIDGAENILQNTLETSRAKFSDEDPCALYDYQIAELLTNQGRRYNAKNESTHQFRWKLKEALELCNSTISQFKNSRGAQQCAALKAQILDTSIHIRLEEVIPSDSFSKVLVDYSNLDELEFNIYKVGVLDIRNFQKKYRSDQQKEFLKGLSPLTSFSTKLKSEGDHQRHSTEIILPKLANGHYIIMAKSNQTEDSFATSTMQATDFAAIDQGTNTHMVFQIIDRNNGTPISAATVTLRYQTGYNGSYNTKTLTTDSEGKIQLPKQRDSYQNINLTVNKNDETANFDGFYAYYRDSYRDDDPYYNAFLFTDRSIYRPGQTLYFKGIVLEHQKKKSELVTNKSVTVTLKDVNWETIKSIDLKTNEFGSVASEFILPDGGLTGNYTLQIEGQSFHLNGQTQISVEEYKRPKFETSFQPITQTFRINDTITIEGSAQAYAGSHISDAKVVYRVHRKVRYPRWYYWSRPYFSSEPQEITHGVTMTDEKGAFEIDFKAIPDLSVNKDHLPIFNYEITADVTDLNGETRSATTVVNVGYHAIDMSILIDEQIDKTRKDQSISISTENLNGQPVPSEVSVKIVKLKAPDRVLRPRPWEVPDYQTIDKSEYIEKFPHEAYTETAPNTWEHGETVFETTFNTEKDQQLELGNIKKWSSGAYKIIATTTDRFGQQVKDEALTTLFSDAEEQLADNQLFQISTDKTAYKAGDNVLLSLGSAAENMTVTVSVEKEQKFIKTFLVPLNNDLRTIAIPVTTEDVGGFIIHYSFAAFNHFKSGAITVNVPYPQSELNIETMTFRDKLKPGSDETWSFKLKGTKGEKVSAELLASMYDASLDQFKAHNWSFNPLPNANYRSNINFSGHRSFGINSFRVFDETSSNTSFPRQGYDQFNWFGFRFGRFFQTRNRGLLLEQVETQAAMVSEDDTEMDEVGVEGYATVSVENKAADGTTKSELPEDDPLIKNQVNFDDVQIRKNLQETAFFFPQLTTDSEGNVSFSFTTPEALTQWKLQLLGHTKDLASSMTSMTTVTQKELMVIPNAPRFLRQGDQISLSSKISNLTENRLTGQAQLILTDALNNSDMMSLLLPSRDQQKSFGVDAQGNTEVSWSIVIPETIQAVQYKIVAKAGDFSDGEQNSLPVLTNRMLVTETLPMWVRSNETRTFTLDKLKTTTSTTLKHHQLTLEITSNPAWYAVQSLPYLMEYPFECNEQTFSRYYANALASHIANSNPRIREVFNQWKNSDALISNLEKNQELKSILIEETPWLRDAQSETEQKKRIALLFDMNKMTNELNSAKRKLINNQMGNGSWPWFNGGRPNRFITQHIITGFGHLDKLKVKSTSDSDMITRAISYLDAEFIREYKDLTKYDKEVDLSKDHLSHMQIHYLYMRSFFPKIKASKEVETIKDYYLGQIQAYWPNKNLYSKGMLALVVSRNGDKKTAQSIINSLKETSVNNDELGMYWKENTASWYWYQAPIETQALMIEAFSELTEDTKSINNLKVWLLKNKQTNSWKTTKATANAAYALLLQGSDWLSVTEMVDVAVGGKAISPESNPDIRVEAGTGYYKTSWGPSEIKSAMATVEMKKNGSGIAWGSLYWQYFEDLDKVTSAETPLSLKKELYLKKNTDKGEQLSKISTETELKIGDLVRVRLELRSDRAMEFVHMKDMRAAGLEPINVLSSYKWQDGLGYYESTKDASTNFFFDYLPKGVYVFEYDLRVNNSGNMSNGITTIESMYAPEFRSHSKGVRITVTE